MGRIKYGLWAVVIILGGILVAQTVLNAPTGPNASKGPGSVTGISIGGDFVLTDHTGARFDTASLRGRLPLLYFGYSFCPDVCPLELEKMGRALIALEESGLDTSKVAPVFVTIDPERDTPEVLAEYVPYFHDRMIGLTGTQEEIDQAASLYRVRAARSEVEGADYYLMDHTSLIFFLDEEGQLIRFFTSRDSLDDISDAVRKRL